MQIGQNGAARLGASDPFQGQFHVGVGRMRRPAQGVDDPDVEIGQGRPALFRKADGVGRVGHLPEPIADRADLAVIDVEGGHRDRAAGTVDFPGLTMGRDQVSVADGRITASALEDVAEAPLQAGRRIGVHIGRHALAGVEEEGPQVVDAVDLVGVVMGEQAGVHSLDLRPHRLQPEVRRGVD